MDGGRTYGYLYDKGRPQKDDAANMRRHIRTMVKAGVLPAGWVFSVRYRTFAGGCSVDIAATSPQPIYAADPEPRESVWNPETGGHVWAWKDRLTLEARAVLDTLEDLHAGHNHDGSDITTDYFDVKFYGGVTLDVVDGVARFEPAAVAS